MSRRKRRVFTEEQKLAAVEHVKSTGKTERFSSSSSFIRKRRGAAHGGQRRPGRRAHIVGREVREIRHDLLWGHPARQVLQNVSDRDPRAADGQSRTWPALPLLGGHLFPSAGEPAA
jgi:transposase-like protein